jgi:hypothetical protein
MAAYTHPTKIDPPMILPSVTGRRLERRIFFQVIDARLRDVAAV